MNGICDVLSYLKDILGLIVPLPQKMNILLFDPRNLYSRIGSVMGSSLAKFKKRVAF